MTPAFFTRGLRSVFGVVVLVVVVLVAAFVAAPAFGFREYESRVTGTPTGVGGSEVPFKEPQGIAVDGSNDLWVSDIKVAGSNEGEALIDEFGPTNEFVVQGRGKKPETAKEKIETKGNKIICKSTSAKFQEWSAEHWHGTSSRSIAFADANGHLYIEDPREDQIWVMNEGGCVVGEVFPTPVSFALHGSGGTTSLFYIAVDNSSDIRTRGDVYVAANEGSFAGRVFRIAGAGEGPNAAVPTPFSCSAPYVSGDELKLEGVAGGVAVDPGSGDLFVTVGNGVEEFDPSGCFVRRISEIDGHNLSLQGAVAVDPSSGHLLVAEAGANVNGFRTVRVDEFSLSTGEALPEQIIEANGAPFGGIVGLTVSSSGDLYVSEGTDKAVDEFGHFVPPPKFLLSVDESGSGAGGVSSVPSGIDCPSSSCSASFTKNAGVVLTEKPETGSRFSGWNGCDSEEGPEKEVCKVTVSAARTVTATFEEASHPVLTVQVLGSGSGGVTSVPVGVDCPSSSCSASFVKNEVVTLTEKPAGSPTGSRFSGWSGCDSEEGPGKEICKVTVSEAKTVTATFEPVLVPLEVLEPGLGSGAVTSVPAGFECPFSCTTKFPEGAVVKLTARPALGSTFKEWTGCETVEGPGKETCVVRMVGPGPVSVTAVFEPIRDALSVSVVGEGSVGSRVGSDPGVIVGCTVSGGACSGVLEYGEQVTLIERPGAHQFFKEWSGACSGSTRQCMVTVTEALFVRAVFEAVPEEPVVVTVEEAPVVPAPAAGGGAVSLLVALPVAPAVLLVPPVAAKPVPKPKAKPPLTSAQKLAKALKACRVERDKRKRAGCEAGARKHYKTKTNTKAKKRRSGGGR